MVVFQDRKSWLKGFVVLAGLACFSFAQAELKPISDEEMSDVTGQGAVAFNIVETANTTYTKFTVGMNSEFQINIDNLDAGNYTRTGETLSSDIQVSNLAYGSISTDATQVQIDGLQHAVGDIVPFEAIDPYFEIAQDSTGDLQGFRIGFSQARGTLSGDFGSISGNVGVKITDFFGQDYQSTLLDASGNSDSVRAQYFGIDNTLSGGATDCTTGFYCYSLADYKSLPIGVQNTDGTVGYTDDFFISFQKGAVDWQVSTGMLNAASGAFINLPTALHIDMNTGTNTTGTSRVRTEYIDRGLGLF